MVEDIAMAEGFEVAGIARNTVEAMELASEADIAILDVRLADGLTGPEIAKPLVEHCNVGIAYLTGNPDLVGDRDGCTSSSNHRVHRALSMACAGPQRGTAAARGNRM